MEYIEPKLPTNGTFDPVDTGTDTLVPFVNGIFNNYDQYIAPHLGDNANENVVSNLALLNGLDPAKYGENLSDLGKTIILTDPFSPQNYLKVATLPLHITKSVQDNELYFAPQSGNPVQLNIGNLVSNLPSIIKEKCSLFDIKTGSEDEDMDGIKSSYDSNDNDSKVGLEYILTSDIVTNDANFNGHPGKVVSIKLDPVPTSLETKQFEVGVFEYNAPMENWQNLPYLSQDGTDPKKMHWEGTPNTNHNCATFILEKAFGMTFPDGGGTYIGEVINTDSKDSLLRIMVGEEGLYPGMGRNLKIEGDKDQDGYLNESEFNNILTEYGDQGILSQMEYGDVAYFIVGNNNGQAVNYHLAMKAKDPISGQDTLYQKLSVESPEAYGGFEALNQYYEYVGNNGSDSSKILGLYLIRPNAFIHQ